MGYYTQQYRRSPYAVIISRWKRHFLHLLALIGVFALFYLAWKGGL